MEGSSVTSRVSAPRSQWLLSNSAPSHKLAALSGILLVSTATAGISGPAIVAGTFLLAWLARDGLLPYGGFLSRFWDGCIISANGLLQTIRVPARWVFSQGHLLPSASSSRAAALCQVS